MKKWALEIHSIPMTKEQMEAAIAEIRGNKSMEMRQALCECLDQMMAENENIVVIDADLANQTVRFL